MANVEYSDSMISVEFDSLVDVINLKENDIPSANRSTYQRYMYHQVPGRRSRNSNTRHWYGDVYSAQEVVKRALLGWHEGFDAIKEKVAKLDPMKDNAKHYTDMVQRRKRKVRFQDHGDELDIHKVYQGKLDTAWRSMPRITIDAKHKLVTLMVDVGGNGEVAVEESMWRGAVAHRLTDELIKAGKSVRIMIGSSCYGLMPYNYNQNVTTHITVKQYNEPLSLERLAAMSNVGFHRVFNFSARAIIKDRINPSMGNSNKVIESTPPLQIQKQLDKGHTRYIYIGRSTNEYEALKSLGRCYKQMEKYSNE